MPNSGLIYIIINIFLHIHLSGGKIQTNVRNTVKRAIFLQTGLVYLLYERFRSTLVICTVYFILTTVINVWSLISRWNQSLKHSWSATFLVFFILQRLSKKRGLRIALFNKSLIFSRHNLLLLLQKGSFANK